jgi:hypothetical protein
MPATADVLAMLPTDPSGDIGLWPLGTELHLRTGIDYEDGTEELIGQGVFRISRPVITEGTSGFTVNIDGYDRSRAFSRARFTRPYVINSTTDPDMVSAIKRLAMSRLPILTEDKIIVSSGLEGFGSVPTVTFLKDDDPWKMAQRMAQSIAAELVWMPNGFLWIRSVPNLNERPPDFVYEHGKHCSMTDVSRSLDDERAYNGVTITIENSSRVSGGEDMPPIQVSSWDTDPESPTYFDPAYPTLSRYGSVPYFYSSEFIYDESQGVPAAEAMLQQISGIVEEITWTAIANPAHESGDVLRISHPELNIDSFSVLDSLTIGVGATATMSGTTRRRRVVAGVPEDQLSVVFDV